MTFITIKTFIKYFTFYILLQGCVEMIVFNSSFTMHNINNLDDKETINLTQLEFTSNFKYDDFINQRVFPLYYKNTTENVYHNILSHTNFTCYSSKMIDCVINNNIKTLYENNGINSCGINNHKIILCEKSFIKTYLTDDYDFYINNQVNYTIISLIKYLLYMMFELLLLCFTFIIMYLIYQFTSIN